jgi:hypothetical protein
MKRSRIRRRNDARAKQARADDFGSRERVVEIAIMPCVCGGRHPACTGGWSEPSHVTSRAAGGDADDIVPMSTGCHRAWHARGRETYLAAIGMTLADMLEAAAMVDAEARERADSMP